jgi:hypothetical protein
MNLADRIFFALIAGLALGGSLFFGVHATLFGLEGEYGFMSFGIAGIGSSLALAWAGHMLRLAERERRRVECRREIEAAVALAEYALRA